MDKPLTGRVALVTGGAIRLGRALCEMLADAGAKVAVHAHGSSPTDTLAVIRARGGEAEAFLADLTDDAAIPTLVERVEKTLGPISVLINSAGIFHRVPFTETTLATLDGQWRLNARVPYLLTQAVARGMLARKAGQVVNVVDIGGAFQAWKGYSAYCMSKAALAMLTECLALELAPHIRVNGVAPGTVLPPERLTPQELGKLKARIPLQRFGSPEDVAETVRFLVTGPQFITGQIIAVDGGRIRGATDRAEVEP